MRFAQIMGLGLVLCVAFVVVSSAEHTTDDNEIVTQEGTHAAAKVQMTHKVMKALQAMLDKKKAAAHIESEPKNKSKMTNKVMEMLAVMVKKKQAEKRENELMEAQIMEAEKLAEEKAKAKEANKAAKAAKEAAKEAKKAKVKAKAAKYHHIKNGAFLLHSMVHKTEEQASRKEAQKQKALKHKFFAEKREKRKEKEAAEEQRLAKKHSAVEDALNQMNQAEVLKARQEMQRKDQMKKALNMEEKEEDEEEEEMDIDDFSSSMHLPSGSLADIKNAPEAKLNEAGKSLLASLVGSLPHQTHKKKHVKKHGHAHKLHKHHKHKLHKHHKLYKHYKHKNMRHHGARKVSLMEARNRHHKVMRHHKKHYKMMKHQKGHHKGMKHHKHVHKHTKAAKKKIDLDQVLFDAIKRRSETHEVQQAPKPENSGSRLTQEHKFSDQVQRQLHREVANKAKRRHQDQQPRVVEKAPAAEDDDAQAAAIAAKLFANMGDKADLDETALRAMVQDHVEARTEVQQGVAATRKVATHTMDEMRKGAAAILMDLKGAMETEMTAVQALVI